MEDFILMIAPAVITFLLGLFKDKPGYKKGKNLLKAISKSAEDDKLTGPEAKDIYDKIKHLL
jgi:hypothetical protein